jgi:hypothetical protein
MQKYKKMRPSSKVQSDDLALPMLLTGLSFHPEAFVAGSYQ